jgi:deoxyribonuclease I
MNKTLLFLFVFASQFAQLTWALQPTNSDLQAVSDRQKFYYGADFQTDILHKAHNDEVKEALKKILKSGHIISSNNYDQLAVNCDSTKNCVAQRTTGYDKARSFLFGNFYLVPIDTNHFGLKEMYCSRIYQNDDFKGGQQPGPGIVPDNSIINIEHTWPQSKFSGRYSKELQKSDMHHLFPTDSKMNSLRGNTFFGEVEKDSGKTNCAASRFGNGTMGSVKIFEPPAEHKGHVARALFYFSVRYDLPIRSEEEVILKKWNNEFPVDAEEMARNTEIEKIQNNRNPFVDYPELANQVADF